jgi:hypothetical protein
VRRIEQLEQTVRILEPLANEEGMAPEGSLPELCRQMLQAHPSTGYTASQVMEYLMSVGVDVSSYSNPLAVLHTTLTRIAKPGSGFIKTNDPRGETIYAYTGPGLPPPPPLTSANYFDMWGKAEKKT